MKISLFGTVGLSARQGISICDRWTISTHLSNRIISSTISPSWQETTKLIEGRFAEVDNKWSDDSDFIRLFVLPVRTVSSFAMDCRVGNFACLITFDTIQLFGVLTAVTLEVCQEITLLADTLKSPDTSLFPPSSLMIFWMV